ncbi:phage tail protein [Mesorhizobium loti]|nr:tail fiber protein [Mesorhizobium loti]PLP58280.1 phage tail protein [Mesorhizobium loti]
MGSPYVGEIRMFAGNFAPVGWKFCEGQLVAISEYETLFNLIGTIYGGDGQETFSLPDLRGRIPLHPGSGFILGQNGGSEEVTLTAAQIVHSHPTLASNDIPTQSTPQGNVLGQAAAKFYRAGAPTVSLNAGSVSSVGGSLPHSNFQPYLCIDFIISMFGIYPQQG